MLSVADRERLGHILDAIDKIDHVVEGAQIEQLRNDWQMRLLVERLLEIIGEAANHISVECQEQYSHVPWMQMRNMRIRPHQPGSHGRGRRHRRGIHGEAGGAIGRSRAFWKSPASCWCINARDPGMRLCRGLSLSIISGSWLLNREFPRSHHCAI